MRPPSSVSGSGKSSRPPHRKNSSASSKPNSNTNRVERKPSNARKSHGANARPIDQGKRSTRGQGPKRDARDDSRPRRVFDNPPLPEDLDIKALPSKVKTGLRALSPENAEIVGKEILMTIRGLEAGTTEGLISAARYAKSAAARAGRVGVVREYAGKIALKQGNFQEAKTALRAAHRILGEDALLIDIAAAELGLGRALKALEILGEIDSRKLERDRLIEARVVSARARLVNGQREAASVSLIEKDRVFLVERIKNPLFQAEAQRLLKAWDEAQQEIQGLDGRPS